MEVGLTDHVWSVAELMEEARATPLEALPLEDPTGLFYRPRRTPFKLYMVRGGKNG